MASTNIDFHYDILHDVDFQKGEYDTGFIQRKFSFPISFKDKRKEVDPVEDFLKTKYITMPRKPK